MKGVNGGISNPGVRAFMLDHFADEEVDFVPKTTRTCIQEVVGVSHATVSRWVSGASGVDPTHWGRLARAAGTTVDVLRDYISGVRDRNRSDDGAPEMTVAQLTETVAQLTETVARLTEHVEANRKDLARLQKEFRRSRQSVD